MKISQALAGKSFLTGLGLLFFLGNPPVKAQNNNIRPEPQPHDLIVSIGPAGSFLGFGLHFGIIQASVSNDPVSSFSFPAAAVNVDYGWLEKLSIGACFSWQEMGYKFNNVTYNYITANPSIVANGNTLSWVDTYNRCNIGLRMLYHVIDNKSFQMYFGVRAGYTWWTRRSTNPDPLYNYNPEDLYSRIFINPVSIQSVMGMRYFFNESMGVNLEAGIGAPYALMIGFTGKFK